MWAMKAIAGTFSQPANNVQVFLYYADARSPPASPALDGAINYPGEPASGSAWQLAAPPPTLGFVRPGHPAVVRFEWVPPLRIRDNVALLAVCTCDQGYTGTRCLDCAAGYTYVNGACVEAAGCTADSCSGHGDCDDSNNHVYPGHNDTKGRWGRDGIDNDCNGVIDG